MQQNRFVTAHLIDGSRYKTLHVQSKLTPKHTNYLKESK